MALYPDRIVLKSSTSGDISVRQSIDPTVGSDPIIGGELVISRSSGVVNLFALDDLGVPTLVGSDATGSVAPSVLLNFEEDGTDTDHVIYSTIINPSTGEYKFGTKGFDLQPSASYWASEAVDILAEEAPVFSTDPFTLEFWIKGDASDWWQLDNNGLTTGAFNVFGYQNLHNGPAPFCVYLDCGSTDRGGSGSNTSNATDMAIGSIVFGLGYGETHGQANGISAAGDIVSSRNVSVLDGAWHHVVVSHEGLGTYAIFVDGVAIERKTYSNPVNFSDTTGTGKTMPAPFIIGGHFSINDISAKDIYSFHGSIDAIALYKGVSLYKGYSNFTVPSAPPDGSRRGEPGLTLRAMLDVSIPEPASLTDGDILQWSAAQGAWIESPAPAFNVSGNILGDIGDVTLSPALNILNGELLAWDSASQEWVNKDVQISDLGGLDLSGLAANSILRFNGAQWQAVGNSYLDLTNKPSLLSDFVDDVFTTLEAVGDVIYTTAPAQGDVLAYNANATPPRWEPINAPPANITANSISELGDVGPNPYGQGTSKILLSWENSSGTWVPDTVEYDEISNAPDRLSELIMDMDLGDFYNYQELYLNQASLAPLGLNVFDEVTTTTPLESQVLVYRSGQWVNEYGPPANISTNSIGDLSNVTYLQQFNYVPGELTILGMGELIFDSPDQANNIAYKTSYDNALQSLGFSAIRTSDDTGSWVTVSRGGGVDIRSDVNLVRFRGKPDTTTNRVELRLETGDASTTPSTGEYIGLKLPTVINESTTYFLPGEDGDVGDVLATDGTGNLSWVARIAAPDLGDIQDVDLATIPPANGVALIYNSAASTWIPGAAQADLSSESINALSDVDTTTATPTNGQGLGWDQAAGKWAPMDVAADLSSESIDALSDVDTTTTAPTDGQALIWDNTAGKWEPSDVSGPGTAKTIIAPFAQAFLTGSSTGTGAGCTWTNTVPSQPFLPYWDVTFDTAQPNTDYSVITDAEDFDSHERSVSSKTVNGFRVSMVGSSHSQSMWGTTITVYSSDPTVTVGGAAGGDLGDLNDVNAPSPGDGQGLIWDNANSQWTPGDVAADLSTSNIGDLADVDITGRYDTSGLQWNAATSQYEPCMGGDDLADVVFNESFPLGSGDIDFASVGFGGSGRPDGAPLVWSSAMNEWVLGSPVASTTITAAGDPYLANISLLLDFNSGAEWTFRCKVNSTGWNAIVPSSTSGAYRTISNPKFGYGSGYFFGNGVVEYDDDDRFGFSGDFTIEFWMLDSSITGGAGLISKRNKNTSGAGTWAINRDGSTIKFHNLGPVTSEDIGTCAANVWCHVAVSREAGTLRGYLDGVEGFSITDTTNYTNTETLWLGKWDIAGGHYAGQLDDLRITKGVARYTTGFTVPQSAFPTSNTVGAVTAPLSLHTDVDSSIAPTNGQSLLYDGTAQEWTAGDIQAPAAVRQQVPTVTTSALASAATDLVTMTDTSRGGQFVRVETSHAARVVFYANQSSRSADQTRPSGTAPDNSSGVLLELITTGAEVLEVTPSVAYHNSDPSGNSELYLAVTNLEVGVSTITVDATVIPLEGKALYDQISLATLKTEVAASTDFADFQSRIAAL